MLLFQMHLLELLKLLENSKHILFAELAKVQIVELHILEAQLELHILDPINFDFSIFNRLQLLNNLGYQCTFLVDLLFGTEVRVIVSDLLLDKLVDATELAQRSAERCLLKSALLGSLRFSNLV